MNYNERKEERYTIKRVKYFFNTVSSPELSFIATKGRSFSSKISNGTFLFSTKNRINPLLPLFFLALYLWWKGCCTIQEGSSWTCWNRFWYEQQRQSHRGRNDIVCNLLQKESIKNTYIYKERYGNVLKRNPNCSFLFNSCMPFVYLQHQEKESKLAHFEASGVSMNTLGMTKSYLYRA